MCGDYPRLPGIPQTNCKPFSPAALHDYKRARSFLLGKLLDHVRELGHRGCPYQ
jgi:hypothetical protein